MRGKDVRRIVGLVVQVPLFVKAKKKTKAGQFAIGSDFVNTALACLLMEKREETHPTELADLLGRRLVIASETNQGAKLAESTLGR